MTSLQQNNSTTEKTKARKSRAFCRRSPRSGIGIQWRLMGYLSLFVAFALLVLWIFQVGMLIPFYESVKHRELEQVADLLSVALDNMEEVSPSAVDQFNDTLWDCAERYSTCVTVWRVVDGRARHLSEADVSDDCIIHKVTAPKRFAEMYQMAKSNGGDYFCKVMMHRGGIIWMDEHGNNQVADGLHEGDISQEEMSSDNEIYALHMQLTRGGDGSEYILLLEAELTPVSATVSTLKAQFSLIALILLLGAVLLAWFLSRRISRPLVRMNEAARTLAKGEYDVHFVGNGYRETRELAQTLNFAAQELSKIDRLQKELISNISHDLRTPLTMIKGYGEVMRDLPGENTPENVQVIIDEATYLSELVNDLLDLSRLQAGMRTPEMEVFGLTEAVRAVLSRYDTLTRYEGCCITFEAEQDVAVCADRTMLLQVIYNLINNAINYCGEDKTVEVIQRVREDGYVRLSIIDHGEGISQQELPYIWDRYYKIDRVHRRAMIGTGLGLSIVKGALEMHGASYGVESREGEGSEFWFDLPVVDLSTDINDEQAKEF